MIHMFAARWLRTRRMVATTAKLATGQLQQLLFVVVTQAHSIRQMAWLMILLMCGSILCPCPKVDELTSDWLTDLVACSKSQLLHRGWQYIHLMDKIILGHMRCIYSAGLMPSVFLGHRLALNLYVSAPKVSPGLFRWGVEQAHKYLDIWRRHGRRICILMQYMAPGGQVFVGRSKESWRTEEA